MANTKARGYMKYLAALDVETSGLCFNSDSPSTNVKTGERYQIVSIGLIVVDADTLTPVEELYREIKWDGTSDWSDRAEKVHGLSRKYLEENGVDGEEAVIDIASLLLKYWGADGVISLIGHNVATFDKFFLLDLMREHGIEIKIGNRHIDSHAVAFTTFGTYNSDDAFEYVGVALREGHNALDDARASLKVIKTVRDLWQQVIEA